MEPLRIIISGGGTGGHIFPAIAIGQALQRLQPDTELLYVGANGKMEMEKVPLAGFKIVGLDIAGLNRSAFWKNLTLPWKLVLSRLKAQQIIKEFKPMVAVGVGGYASFPLLQAAQANKIPTLIQEQNSYAGKSNKILGRKAAAVCVAYNNMEKFFPIEKLSNTGNPVRKEIATMAISKPEAMERFKLSPDRKTVLVVGGSLGAQSINDSISAGLPRIVAAGVNLIWQTGNGYYGEALKLAAAFEERVKVFNFIREMDFAYTAADLVISRAGALAIAELCIAAKPVIFVPYPHAAEGHQDANARALEAKHSAVVVNDADAATMLVATLEQLLANQRECEVLAKNIKSLGVKDADERIAHIVIALAKKES